MVQHELRLDRLAIVSLSKHLWQHDKTKAELLKIFTSTRVNTEASKDDGDALTKKVSESAKKLLPTNLNSSLLKQLEEKLSYVVKTMGKAIFLWLSEVNLKLKVPNNSNQKKAVEVYLNNIIWNDIGMIDWSKTIRTMIDKEKLPNNYMEYVELCFNCLEEDIENWYQKKSTVEINNIKNLIQQHYRQRNRKFLVSWQYDDLYLFVYWHLRFQKGSANFTTKELVNYFCTYFEDDSALYRCPIKLNENLSVDANMFVLCALHYKHLGLLYFWQRMDEESRSLVFVRGFKKILQNQLHYWYECSMECSLFMLNNVPSKLARTFINKIHEESMPVDLLCSPWTDVSPEIMKLLKFFKIRRNFKIFKSYVKSGVSKSLLFSKDGIEKFLNDTLRDSPHEFAEVFDYTIAEYILRHRYFLLYKNIFQHEAFEKTRFKIAIHWSARYFGTIDDDGGITEKLFMDLIQDVLKKDEKDDFLCLRFRAMYNKKKGMIDVDVEGSDYEGWYSEEDG